MKLRDMALCALFSALLAICSWICVPLGEIAFTLQTFCVFLTLDLLGGKRGSLSILIYLLLGALGLPVFSGFRGGLGVLLGTSGGYIWGFLAAAGAFWGVRALFPRLPSLFPMLLGLAVCYFFGTAWYLAVYLQGRGLAGVLLQCVVPFVLPDLFKLVLALLLSRKLKPFVY